MRRMTRRDFLKASAFAGGSLLLPKRAYATSPSNLIPFTSDIALELSDSLGDCFAPGVGITPERATRVVDLDGQHRGWAVDFCGTGGEPYGYAVLDAVVDGLLLQATIAEGKNGLVDSIKGAANGAARNQSLLEETAVMASPLQFGLVDERPASVVFNNSEVINIGDLSLGMAPQSVDPIEWNTIMIPEDDVRQGKYQVSDANFLYDYNYAPNYEVKAHTSHYACAVSALYSIGGTLYTSSGPLIDCYSDWDEYQKIWDYTLTGEDKNNPPRDGVTFGTTASANIGSGFQSYCASRGFDINHSYNPSRPAYIRFKEQVSEQRHSVFTAGIVMSDGSSGTKVDGHAMAVYGWADVKTGNSTTANLYLFDGWSNMVFLNYSYTGFQWATGTFFDK